MKRKRRRFAFTSRLDRAQARFPWARAWVAVPFGFLCFESVIEARLYRDQRLGYWEVFEP
jgi:hypothetical protein